MTGCIFGICRTRGQALTGPMQHQDSVSLKCFYMPIFLHADTFSWLLKVPGHQPLNMMFSFYKIPHRALIGPLGSNVLPRNKCEVKGYAIFRRSTSSYVMRVNWLLKEIKERGPEQKYPLQMII